MTLRKITDKDLQGYGVIGMADTPNLSARAMQEKVEEVVRSVVIPIFNENMDSIATKEDVADAVLNAGAGDMSTFTYDNNLDGIVNNADNGFFTYTHSGSTLTGRGNNGKFKATSAGVFTSFYVNGTSYTVTQGDDNEIELYANAWYTFILDGTTINFNQGGAGLNYKVTGGTTAPASPKENMIWVNYGDEITSYDFSAEQPCRRSYNKNFMVYPYYHTTMTTNGLTFTDNGDGSVTINGTATADTFFRCSHAGEYWMALPKGTYTLSGVTDGSGSTYQIEVGYSYDGGSTVAWASSRTEPATFTTAADSVARCNIKVYSGAVLKDVVIRPQLERGSAATAFVKGSAHGQVWIRTGSKGRVALNTLKKNGVWEYPQAVMVYNRNTGSWDSKAAKIYRNGTWQEFVQSPYYIYNTGSSDSGYSIYSYGSTYSKGESTYGGTTCISIITRITANDQAAIRSKNKIDLTGYSRLKALICTVKGYGDATAGTPNVSLFVTDESKQNINNASSEYSTCVAVSRTTGAKSAWTEISLAVASISGEYYVGVGNGNNTAGASQLYVKALWLE